jgi:hypothetical protein
MLMEELNNITVNNNTKLCPSDTENMYTNILTEEINKIVTNILTTHNTCPTIYQQELLKLLDTTLSQNYFQFNQNQYKQISGLAMGTPTSAILSESFLQYLEHNHIIHILQKHNIIGYYRYADNILIIYNIQITQIQNTLNEFYSTHNVLKFTMETEKERKLNFLDITLKNKGKKTEFNNYRKPTNTDHLIHQNSCHPYEH